MDLYRKEDVDEKSQIPIYKPYTYPWDQEVSGAEAEIEFVLNISSTMLEDISLSVPPLKYNKSLLFMLTQDDCMHGAFCKTWAAINGKPITWYGYERNYYYDIEQLEAIDIPPNTYSLGKTLGSTDGHGNEVRFHFTTTLAPEWDFMSADVIVDPGFDSHYSRFYMKSGLRWNNVREMLNYGTGIAFHDVKAADVYNVGELVEHLALAQVITLDSLYGRGIKSLAEPNGNKSYLNAAKQLSDIQTMSAQTGTYKLRPYQTTTDLNKEVLHRVFVNSGNDIKPLVRSQMQHHPEQREAIHYGIHETGNDVVQLLSWLNENYGKDGVDSLWFPSQEEYYEYNYYRHHCQLQLIKGDNTIKIKVKFPHMKYFYYPSLTLNVEGLTLDDVKSVSSNNVVTGLSYGAYKDGVSINIDCRKFLYEQATYYVQKYLDHKNISNLRDANYFINMLKGSAEKEVLLAKIENR